MMTSSKGATIKPLREDSSSSSKGISGAYFFDRVSDIVDDAVGIFVGDQLMPSSNSNSKQRERAQLAAAAIRSRQEVSAIYIYTHTNILPCILMCTASSNRSAFLCNSIRIITVL
jgi:hypothetical protein